MSGTGCPSHEELYAYLVGKLSVRASEAVFAHLSACPSCQQALQELKDAEYALLARLRHPPAEEPALEEPRPGEGESTATTLPGGPPPAAGEPTEVSTTAPAFLGEYQLLEKLGEGGMGKVYKALHTKLDRMVALKVLPRGRLADGRAVARFEREMKAIGRLDHPNIVRAHDAREIDGTRFLVMEYVEGRNLSDVVRRCGPLRIPDACELVRQAAVGLQYAHEHHLVHRDIKTSNLMLTRQGEVKILDLGLARFRAEQPTGEEVTATGVAMGTADYMAPEQASDSRAVDIRADIYSLGCTLYKLLAGRVPFSDLDYKSAFEKIMAHVQQPVPPIRRFRPDVPDTLAAVLDRMLAKDPAARFATPAEVADALESLCAGRNLPGLLAQAERGPEASAEADPSVSAADRIPTSTLAVSEPRESRRVPLSARRRWKLLAAAIALILLVIGVLLAFGIVNWLRGAELPGVVY